MRARLLPVESVTIRLPVAAGASSPCACPPHIVKAWPDRDRYAEPYDNARAHRRRSRPPGLVAAVADVVTAHGGNWENSELAELAGAFAGIIEVSVAADRVDELRAALSGLDGSAHRHRPCERAERRRGSCARQFAFRLVGNDHPGIVREISATLSAQGLSIERMRSETRDAAMSGGRLFEAADRGGGSGIRRCRRRASGPRAARGRDAGGRHARVMSSARRASGLPRPEG